MFRSSIKLNPSNLRGLTFLPCLFRVLICTLIIQEVCTAIYKSLRKNYLHENTMISTLIIDLTSERSLRGKREIPVGKRGKSDNISFWTNLPIGNAKNWYDFIWRGIATYIHFLWFSTRVEIKIEWNKNTRVVWEIHGLNFMKQFEGGWRGFILINYIPSAQAPPLYHPCSTGCT